MLDAYRDLIDDLLESPAEVRATFESQGTEKIPSEARRLVAALRDRDRTVLGRVQTMTRQEAPYLRELETDDGSNLDDSPTLLEEMETARGDLVSLLINLSLKDWERRAVHETRGDISLADEVEGHVEFDEKVRRRLQELLR